MRYVTNMMRYDIRGIPDDAKPGVYATEVGPLEVRGDDTIIPLIHNPKLLPEQSLRPVTVGV